MPTVDRLSGVTEGLAIKAPVRAATTANVTLSGEQTIDGVAVTAGDRVLVKDQSTGAQNGIYVVSTGTWLRAADFDSGRDITKGTLVFVTDGNANGSKQWRVTSLSPIIDSTTISFTELTVAGTDGADGLPGAVSVTSPEFGAVGDGVTDDTMAFINAIKDNAFVVVPQPDVAYVISDMIQIPKGHIVMGLGMPLINANCGAKYESTVTLTFSQSTAGSGVTITASAPYFFDEQWSQRDIRVFDAGASAEPKFVFLGNRVSTTVIEDCHLPENLAGTGAYAWEYGRNCFELLSFAQLYNFRIICDIQRHQSRYPNSRYACGVSLGDPWMLEIRDDVIKEYCVVKNVHIHGNTMENLNVHGHHAYGWVENCIFENVLCSGKTNFAFVNHWTTDSFYDEQAYTTKSWHPARNTYRNCHAFVNPRFDMPYANAANDIRILTKSWWDAITTGTAVTIAATSYLPPPLQPATTYYVIKRPAPRAANIVGTTIHNWYCIQLAETLEDANAGIGIHIDAQLSGTNGTMTVTRVSGGSASQCAMSMFKTGRNGFRWSGAAFSRFEDCSTDFGEGFEIFPGDRGGFYAQNIDPADNCSELSYINCISYNPDGFGFQCAANGNWGGTYGAVANGGGPNDIWYGNQYGNNASLSLYNCRVVLDDDRATRTTMFSFSWMNKVTMVDCEGINDNQSLSRYGLSLFALTDFSATGLYLTSRLGVQMRNVKNASFVGSRFHCRAYNYASSSPTSFSLGSSAAATCSLYDPVAVGDATIRLNQLALGGTVEARMKLTSAEPVTPGTGYAVGNTLSVAGGTATSTATVTVATIDANGGVTSVSVGTAGVYSVLPESADGGVNANSVTGGTGTGAKVRLRWGINTIDITDAGNGMFDVPRVIIRLATADASTAINGSATATLTSTGSDAGESLASITVNTSGELMSVIPTVVVAAGGSTIVPGTFLIYSVTGTATAGASTTLTDSTKTWTTNQFADYIVEITGGTGIGQQRVVTSNTGTVLTVNAAWDTNPDATSAYSIKGTLIAEGVATQEQQFTNLPVNIKPSRIIVPDGATMTIQNHNNTTTIDNCEIEGYSYGLRAAGTIPNRNIRITNSAFRSIAYFVADLTAVKNAVLANCTFSDCGRYSGSVDLRVVNIGNYATDVKIQDNFFADDFRVRFVIYVNSGAKNVQISGNHINTPNNGASSAAAIWLTNSDNSLWQVYEDGNFFGPLVTVKRNGTSGGRYLFDGTVPQGSGSGKGTPVTLHTRTGAITMDGTILNADTTVSFVLTSTGIDADDEIRIWHASGGTVGSYLVHAVPANGTATIYVRNITSGNLTESPVLKYRITKRS